jgi:hypothetical protein
MRPGVALDSRRSAAVYGTLLLAAAMAAARDGDAALTATFLDEATGVAERVGADVNHLWTAFGPTNVVLHRVATAMALGDLQQACTWSAAIDVSHMPLERQVLFLFDRARLALDDGEPEKAVDHVVAAANLAPEQVHHHAIGRQLVDELDRSPIAAPDRRRRLSTIARHMSGASRTAS